MIGNNKLRDEGGFALLLSLLVVLLLTVLILELDFQARADLRAAGNFRDDLKAFYLARSAVSAGEAILKDDLRFSPKYDGLDELWAYPVPDYPLGDGMLSGSIADEEGKFNLNSLVDATGKSKGSVVEVRQKRLQRLFKLLGLNPDLVDPIVDWIDNDNEPRPFGAEDETYRRLDPAYSVKNARFDTLEELHMVKGITDEVYHKIAPYLTVYGNANNGAVNVNTADALVLQSLDAEEGIDDNVARRLIENRPYDEPGKFINGLPAEVKTRIPRDVVSTKSNTFAITAEGKVQNTRKIVRAIVDRSRTPMELLYFKVE